MSEKRGKENPGVSNANEAPDFGSKSTDVADTQSDHAEAATPEIRATPAEVSTAGPSSNYKTRGMIDAPSGTGVLGHNTATSGHAHGVEGITDSELNEPAGVYGEATRGSGQTFGVYGVTQSPNTDAVGVQGFAPEGDADGVIGIANKGGIGVGGATDSPSQPAMLALNWATSGRAIGHRAETDSSGDDSTGVIGVATQATGRTYGVQGATHSADEGATGVRGMATQGSGHTFGVLGRTDSLDDFATGVKGEAGQSGVVQAARGVAGFTRANADIGSQTFTYGVFGHATGTGGTTGVLGNNASDPDGWGVVGRAVEGTGVRGVALSDANGTTAVQGESRASTGQTIGVEGVVNSPDGYGVHSEGDSRTVGDHEVTGNVAVGDLVSKRAHTKAYLSTSQTVPYATAEKIQFDAIAGDDFSSSSNGFDTSSHSYFVPSGGHYRVDASVAYNDPMGDVDNHNLYFYLNGSIEARWRRQTGNTTGEFVHDHGSTLFMDLSTGDEIHVAIEHHVDSGVEVETGKQYTHVSISHVG